MLVVMMHRTDGNSRIKQIHVFMKDWRQLEKFDVRLFVSLLLFGTFETETNSQGVVRMQEDAGVVPHSFAEKIFPAISDAHGDVFPLSIAQIG